MKVFLSCGHNNAYNFIKDEHGKWRLSLYRDQGASVALGDAINTEYQYARKIVNTLMKYPVRDDVTYVMVPEKLNLQDRVSWINKNAVDGDMCIELHMDSFKKPDANGSSIWYMSGSDYAKTRGEIFIKEYTRMTGIKSRGTHGDLTNRNTRLGFVRDTKCLAYLLEMGFITNKSDRDTVWLNSAEAIHSAISLITPL